ncbi:cytochrome b subunit of formate dehydrogenase [Neobacillus niacini]|nr:cytochrome b subunit of formate dehydrogenase [Neobacillus niacini]
MSRILKWVVACLFFLLLLNGFGIFAVQLLGK